MASSKPKQILSTLAIIAFAIIFAIVLVVALVEMDERETTPEPDPTKTEIGIISRAEKTWHTSGVGGYVVYTTIWINGKRIQLAGDIDLAVGKFYEIIYNSKTGELLDARLLEG